MNHCTTSQLIAFEAKIVDRFKAGELPFLLHLSGGNEEQLIDIFKEIQPDDWVLGSHRAHFHYLLKGGSPEDLEREICEGRSMFLYRRSINFLNSAILGGTCGIAAGLALAFKRSGSGQRAFCFLGDAAEEGGAFFSAALFVEANDLPCVFIVEDNGIQVDTPKAVRRGTSPNTQGPLDHFACVRRYEYKMRWPHAGAGLAPGSVTFGPAIVARHAAR